MAALIRQANKRYEMANKPEIKKKKKERKKKERMVEKREKQNSNTF